MAESFEFEVRPIEGATAVIGEEVTFRNEGGRLYALNEDGEAFGIVPKAVAARLEAAGIDSLAAEVASRAGGMPTISVAGLDGEGAVAGAAGAATAATTAAAADAVSAKESAAEEQQPVEQQPAEQQPAKQSQPAEQPQPEQPQPEQPRQVEATQPVAPAQPVETVQPAAATQPAATADDSASSGQAGKKPVGKYILIGVIVVLAIVLVICIAMLFSGSDSDSGSSGGTQTVSDGTISLEVPADWEVDEDDGTYIVNSTDHEAVLTLVTSTDVLDGSLTADEVCSAVAEGASTDEGSEVDEDSMEETVTDEGVIIRVYDYDYTYEGEDYDGNVEIILSGSSISVIAEVCSEDAADDYEDALEDALDSVTVLDPSEPDLLDADAAEEEEEDEEEEAVEDDDEEDSSESTSSSSSELLDPEILESGYYIDEDGYVYYAVCWQNPNEGYAIEFPELTITGRDADGSITFAETQMMDILLPGEVQYVACSAGNGTETATVEFGVSQVDDDYFVATDEVAEEYYTISNTSEIEDGYGNVTFTGEITTEVELEDVSMVWLSLVLRDEDGNIVYGYFDFADLAAEGGTVAFEIDAYDVPNYATYEIYAIPW